MKAPRASKFASASTKDTELLATQTSASVLTKASGKIALSKSLASLSVASSKSSSAVVQKRSSVSTKPASPNTSCNAASTSSGPVIHFLIFYSSPSVYLFVSFYHIFLSLSLILSLFIFFCSEYLGLYFFLFSCSLSIFFLFFKIFLFLPSNSGGCETILIIWVYFISFYCMRVSSLPQFSLLVKQSEEHKLSLSISPNITAFFDRYPRNHAQKFRPYAPSCICTDPSSAATLALEANRGMFQHYLVYVYNQFFSVSYSRGYA